MQISFIPTPLTKQILPCGGISQSGQRQWQFADRVPSGDDGSRASAILLFKWDMNKPLVDIALALNSREESILIKNSIWVRKNENVESNDTMTILAEESHGLVGSSATASMMTDNDNRTGSFPPTEWTKVIKAAEGSEDALSNLCDRYWFPLYAYLRRKHSREMAEDLIQGFLSQFLRRKGFERVDPEKGKLRAYLLRALNNFVTSEWRKQPKVEIVTIDFGDAETRIADSSGASSVEIYDLCWASTLLNGVYEQLRANYEEQKKADRFDLLYPFFSPTAEERKPYADVAQDLEMTVSAARQAVKRLKTEFSDMLKKHVKDTLHDPDEEDVMEEIRYLFKVLSA